MFGIKRLYLKFFALSFLFISLIYSFQNCSSSTVGFSISDSDRAYYESTPEKTIEIDVKERASAPNNLKIAFFLDESASMLAVKDRVAQGLDSLAKRITGLRASVKFFGVSQNGYELANINSATLTADQFNVPNEVVRTIGSNLGVLPPTFAANLAYQYQNLQYQTVTSENGRIALAKVLANDSDKGFFKSNDVGVAILISDEDDPVATESSKIAVMLKSSGRLAKRLNFTFEATNIAFKYRSTLDDGTLSLSNEEPESIFVSRARFPCTGGTVAPQDPTALAVIREYFANKPEIANNITKITSCYGQATHEISFTENNFTFPSTTTFGCSMTNFSYRQSTTKYAKLTDLVNQPGISGGLTLVADQPCQVIDPLNELNSVKLNSSFVRTDSTIKTLRTVMNDQTGSTVVNDFIAKRAQQIFGDNKFYFAALVNKEANDPNCRLATEQKIGTGYIELASLLNGKTHSICSPSYANVMDELSEFISKQIDGYHIPAGRRINSATLIKANGTTLLLELNVDFRFDGEYFALISDKAVAGDKVIIKYQ